MSDLELAVAKLDGHSLCLCRDGAYFTEDGRGISPVMRLLESGQKLAGYSAADVIVGKAAAMLFVRAGIVAVHGRVMSEHGREFLEAHAIPCSWEVLTERIVNRSGTGLCPMEQAVAELSDTEEGYRALKERIREMKR